MLDLFKTLWQDDSIVCSNKCAATLSTHSPYQTTADNISKEKGMIVKTATQQHSPDLRQRAQGAWCAGFAFSDQSRSACLLNRILTQSDLPAQLSPSDSINFALPTVLSGTDLQPSIRGASPQVFGPH